MGLVKRQAGNTSAVRASKKTAFETMQLLGVICWGGGVSPFERLPHHPWGLGSFEKCIFGHVMSTDWGQLKSLLPANAWLGPHQPLPDCRRPRRRRRNGPGPPCSGPGPSTTVGSLRGNGVPNRRSTPAECRRAGRLPPAPHTRGRAGAAPRRPHEAGQQRPEVVEEARGVHDPPQGRGRGQPAQHRQRRGQVLQQGRVGPRLPTGRQRRTAGPPGTGRTEKLGWQPARKRPWLDPGLRTYAQRDGCAVGG